jgi:hypothetical protein
MFRKPSTKKNKHNKTLKVKGLWEINIKQFLSHNGPLSYKVLLQNDTDCFAIIMLNDGIREFIPIKLYLIHFK